MLNIKGNREFVKWWNYWMERIHSNKQASTLRDSPPAAKRDPERAPTDVNPPQRSLRSDTAA